MLNRNYFEDLASWHNTLKNSGVPILIYGTGDGCEKVLDAFKKHDIKCSGIFSSDDFAKERKFRGFDVMSLSQAESRHEKFAVASAFGTSLPEIMKRIEALAQRHTLVFPSTSVIGDEMFSKEGFLERFDDAQKVYGMLADEMSRQVFKAVTAFKITGDISFLKPAFSSPDEAFENILRLGGSEIYVDAGAYTGDTIAEFLCRTHGAYERIYALEPNRKNFRKCLKNTIALDNISLCNSPAWSHDCYLNFTSGAGRQQQVSDNGTSVWARSIDSLLDGRRATYIKYDVEGADAEAIRGSRETIRKYSPKICTALYHRAYDMLDIPLLIRKYLPKSRYYIRQYQYYPAWETNLFIVT